MAIVEGPCGLKIRESPDGDRVVNIERLYELGESGICLFCFGLIPEDESDECPHCGNPAHAWLALPLTCPFCRHANRTPFPLDTDMNCAQCGEPI